MVTDPDPGQATFAQPTIVNTFGTWNVATSGDRLTWTYTLNIATAPASQSTDTLTIKSADGTTTVLTVTIAGNATGGIPIVTSVPAADYSQKTYAADKLAVFNMLNDDRSRCGFGKVAQNTKLDAAAQAHADYLATNQLDNTHYEQAGLPGFTGYNSGSRATSQNYAFSYASEIIASEDWGPAFLNSLNSGPITEFSSTHLLKRLYSTVYHLGGAMDRITEIGVGVSGYAYNTPGGTLNTKYLNIDLSIPSTISSAGQQINASDVATFPCQGSTNLVPDFRGEDPDPFPNVDRSITPYGHPVYVMARIGNTLTLTFGSMTLRGGTAVPTTILTQSNDPNNRLLSNQAFLVPTTKLADNSTYDVVINGTNNGTAFTRSFSFTTGTSTSQ